MGAEASPKNAPMAIDRASFDRHSEKARDFFEQQLKEYRLSAQDIEGQTLDQLKRSLATIEGLIANPDQLATYSVKSSAGAILASVEAHIEVKPLALLLERKALILDRIRLLSGDEKIESLRGLIETVADEEIKKKLEEEVNELQAQSQRLTEESEEAQLQAQSKRAAEVKLIEVEALERRWKVRQEFLARESVATIIGALLLVILTITQVVAMFSNTTATEIVNNSFLIILGYFFGQTVSRESRRTDLAKSEPSS
jgi:hypothetical protein